MREYAKKSLSLLTFVILLGAILILINILSLAFWGRADLTKDKIYSLSPATKKTLANLEDNLYATAYFSKDLPSRFGTLGQYVKDMLEDYKSYSGGKLNFSFVDPSSDPANENKAKEAGCPPLTLQQTSSDEFSTKKVYMCMQIKFADKTEMIPALSDPNGLEFELTSLIKKLTAKTTKIIAVAQGNEEPALNSPQYGPPDQKGPSMDSAREALGKTYKLLAVDLTADDAFKKLQEASTLLIVSPKKKFEEKQRVIIDQFLMSGKSLGLFLDKVQTDLNTFQASVIDLGLEDMLSYYGFVINPDLVLDKSNQMIGVTQRAGGMTMQVPVQYPLFPVARKFRDFDGLNPEENVTAKLEGVVFPFVSSITIKDTMADKKFTWFAKSSPMSWKQSQFFQINPMQLPAPTGVGDKGPYTLVAGASGSFDSFFRDRASEASALLGGIEIKSKSPEARILLSGNGLMFNERFMSQQNMSFILNSIDWLAQDEDLMSIRAKGFAPKPIDPDVSQTSKTLVKYGNIVGVPALFLLLGIILWQLRIARRNKLANEFFKSEKTKKD